MGGQLQHRHFRKFLSQQQGARHSVFILRFCQPGDRLQTCFQKYRLHALLFKPCPALNGDLVRKTGCKHSLPYRKRHGFVYRRDGERDLDGKTTSLSLSARNLHPASHSFQKALYNRHSKSRALYPAGSGISLPLKRIKNTFQKFRTHPDPVIFTRKIQPYRVRTALSLLKGILLQLGKTHTDLSILSRIFYCIPNDIDQNLPQMEYVSDQIFPENLPDLNRKILLFAGCLRARDHRNIVNQIRKGKNLFIQGHTAALNP